MDDKPVTLIVSDLHMGDGGPGDDFVNDKQQFAEFLRTQAATPEGQAGRIELIINGDFLEFVQVLPGAYKLGSTEYWCSEDESLAKLNAIIRGHKPLFNALRDFQGPAGRKERNRVTLFPGNHDVDLYWPSVRDRLREVADDIKIEFDDVCHKRHGEKLWIGHGHLFPSLDPANGFKSWPKVALDGVKPPRLEMCPGTFFVIKFVNLLEAKYPFADNLHPETALAGILWREDAWGLKTVAWLLTKFAALHPQITLSAEEGTAPDVGRYLLEAIAVDPVMQAAIAELYRDVLGQAMTPKQVPKELNSEAALMDFVEKLMRAEKPWERWVPVLERARPDTLSADETSGPTLTIYAASKVDVRKECIELAKARWRAGAQVAVFGHTHLPQIVEQSEGRYYNPGSWTRYVDGAGAGTLTLEDLKREDTFPYQLNYVRVERAADGTLKSKMTCWDEQVPPGAVHRAAPSVPR